MKRVLVLGAGKIGRMIARLLLDSHDYDVTVGDSSAAALERISRRVGVDTTPVDVESPLELQAALGRCDVVISALGHGRQRVASIPTALSSTAKAARLPRPPEELVDASQDRVHEDAGPVRAGRGVRTESGS